MYANFFLIIIFFLTIGTHQLSALRAAALLMPPLIDANEEQDGA